MPFSAETRRYSPAMTPLKHARLLFLPPFLVGLYLGPRVLIPGPLGIVIGVAAVSVAVAWAVLTVRRSRSSPGER
jgi:hypothetical protein